MEKINSTKSKISSVAWKLFYEQGYEATTVDQIISECGISKGNFYHYFHAKDDLLNTLSDIFDDEYKKIILNEEEIEHLRKMRKKTPNYLKEIFLEYKALFTV